MDPWRKKRGFMDGFFTEFDEDFRRMQRHMARVFEEAKRQSDFPRNYVYGFNIRLGPDGKPQINEFGDVPSLSRELPGGREPLVDVLDEKETITVVAELPGVERSDIDLNADEGTLVIKVDKPERKYYKEIQLTAKVNPQRVRAKYKNGILEVNLRRMEPKLVENKKRVEVD